MTSNTGKRGHLGMRELICAARRNARQIRIADRFTMAPHRDFVSRVSTGVVESATCMKGHLGKTMYS
jgi:hypothetical protein